MKKLTHVEFKRIATELGAEVVWSGYNLERKLVTRVTFIRPALLVTVFYAKGKVRADFYTGGSSAIPLSLEDSRQMVETMQSVVKLMEAVNDD